MPLLFFFRRHPLPLLVITLLLLGGAFLLLTKNDTTKFPQTSDAFHQPSPTDPIALAQKIRDRCQATDGTCLKDELNRAVGQFGPESTLQAMQKLQDGGALSRVVDDHQLAHAIGRKTAEVFGINGQAFLLCSTSFNYGCQHGFFEYALARTASPNEAIDKICGSLERQGEYSSKFRFYCYHGVGHGVLMARAYDLFSALELCDGLPTTVGQDGCWQGVFMENVNAGMRGEARKDIFSTTNPLAPCDTLAAKYHQECFINHAGWLIQFFQNDIAAASRACLKAPADSLVPCFQSLGLMVSNPSWQSSLTAKIPDAPRDVEGLSWRLCQQFPPEGVRQCVIGAVDNIMNFAELNTAPAKKFCVLVEESYRNDCATHIFISLRSQTTDAAALERSCATLPESYRASCSALR